MAFADDALSEDGFLGGRLRILQPRTGYRAAMDPVLLAAAVPARAGQSVLELGCGAGVASLCLGARVAGLHLSGVELQPDYADLARRNALANRQDFTVWTGDLVALPPQLRAQSFDHVIANPPYFPANAGTAAQNGGREAALRENLPLSEWVRVGMARLKPGGWLVMVQLASRLPDLLVALAGRGGVTVLPLVPREGRAANRLILRAKKGGRGAFTLLSPLILHQGADHSHNGDSHSASAQAILLDGAAMGGFD